MLKPFKYILHSIILSNKQIYVRSYWWLSSFYLNSLSILSILS